jgi:hypothetical protein
MDVQKLLNKVIAQNEIHHQAERENAASDE